MRIFDLLAMCLRSLFRRKLRTFLTVIGVVIGTCSIVVMVSLGVGLNKSNSDQMAQWMDLTNIDVYYSGSMSQNDGASAKKQSENFYLNDEAIEYIKSIPHVVGVSPILPLYQEVSIVYGKYKFEGQVVGMDLKQLENMGYKFKEGRGVNETDTANTAVFGDHANYRFRNTRTNEFVETTYEDGEPTTPPPFDIFKVKTELQINTPNSDQNGGGGTMAKGGMMFATSDKMANGNNGETQKTEKLKNLKFVGRLKGDPAKDYGTLEGIYIDIDWAREIQAQYNKLNDIKDEFKSYQNVKVKVDDFKNVHEVEEKIKKFNFDTYSAEAQLKEAEKSSKMMQMVLGCLGGISMLVAAIGITNTMIMSIYERTREIGVMKVLGCEIKNIRAMFLCEAGAIGLMGGVIGLAFSYTISFVANKIVGNMMGADMGFEMQLSVIPPWLALLGFAFAIGVGLISGFLPANRAVKISALSAIKQE